MGALSYHDGKLLARAHGVRAPGGHGAGESPMAGEGRPQRDGGAARAAAARELTLPAVLESIPQVLRFAEGFLEEQGFPPKVKTRLATIIDEILSNIAKFAYGSSTGDVTVRLADEQDRHRLSVSFIDEGVAFNPLDALPVDVKSAVAKRRIGGQGITIVKNLADTIEYERKDGKNVFRVFLSHDRKPRRSS